MSVESKLHNIGIRISSTYGAPENEWSRGMGGWTVVLRFQRRQMTVPFYMGPALCREPSAADVLSSLMSDASAEDSSFEEWCSDYGYDTDSRKAEATYRACQSNARKLRRLLGDAFDTVASIVSEY